MISKIQHTKIGSVDIIGREPDWSRRVLFLDFDGPINLGGRYKPPAEETRQIIHTWRGIPKQGEWEDFIVNTIHLSYYKEVADLYRNLNCIWITSWKNLTQTKLNPMLDYDFGYVDWQYRGPSDWGHYGKSFAIGEIIKTTGCEWLIVDDELLSFQELIESNAGKPGKLIAPDSNDGLTLDEMKMITEIMKR